MKPSFQTLPVFVLLAAFLYLPMHAFAQGEPDPADPAAAMLRASDGQPMAIWLNHVKPEKREQFEEYLHLFWKASDKALTQGLMGNAERQAYQGVRVLYPSSPNDDGTYTYVFLADPFIEGANYEMPDFLRLTLPEAEVVRLTKMYEDALARPQEEYAVEQGGY